MAERTCWLRCAAAVLMAAATAQACAQTAPGSLTGRLTDAQAHPLAGATVTVRNRQTGQVFVSTASRNGSYEFTGLGPGEYTLEVHTPTNTHGQVEGIVVNAGYTARVSVQLELGSAVMAEAAAAWKPAEADRPVLEPAAERLSAALTPGELNSGPMNAHPTPEAQRKSLEGITHKPAMELLRDSVPATSFEPHAPRQAELLSAPVPSKPLLASSPAAPLVLPRASIDTEIAALVAELPFERPARIEPAMRAVAAASPAALPSAALPSRMVLASPLMVRVAIGAARTALHLGIIPPSSLLAASRAGVADQPLPGEISAEQLALLPLPNRNWAGLLTGDDPDAAGLAPQDRAAFTGVRSGGIAVNGSRTRLSFGAGAGWNRRDAMLQGPVLPESAIRAVGQVTAQDNFGNWRFAESGLRVRTQQGGAGLHGQLSLFNRQNLWNAQNPFSEWVRETAPASGWDLPVFSGIPYTPADRLLRGEAGVGSRLRYGRVGWYAAVEDTERNYPVVATARHPENFFAQPSNDQLQVLAARLRLPSTDPIAEAAQAYTSMLESLNALMGPAARISSRLSGYGRIDWRLTERQQLTVQASAGLWNSPGGGFSRAEANYGTHSLGSNRGADTWIAGHWQAFVTPNLMSATQVQMRRYRHSAPASSPSDFEQAFNINSWGQLPQMVVDSRYGFTIGNPARFGPGNEPDEMLVGVGQRIEWQRGHTFLLAGFELNHDRDGDSMLRNRTGTYHYSNVENFVSDALAFLKYGIAGQLNPIAQHNCDETGRVWRTTTGELHGLGSLPCYSYYSQTLGPSNWWVSSNEFAGYGAARWQPMRRMNLTAQMRWQMQQLPQPIDSLTNPDLPLTQRLPRTGSEWAPGVSLSWGSGESRLPVLHAGYSMFYGRIPNANLLDALTETGSSNGDQQLRMRPTDNLKLGGAPPFPYVLAGSPGSVVKPGAVEFAQEYKNSEVHEAAVSLEQTLPGRIHIEAAAAVTLGRRLPITEDVNFNPDVNPKTITYAVVDGNGSGPIKSPTVTVPFYADWPSALSQSGFDGHANANYQQLVELFSRANSKWEAASLQVTRNGRAFTLHARYTYAHAMDWNPLGSGLVSSITVFDPSDFTQEYGASDLDVRHTATGFLMMRTPRKLHGFAAHIANNWTLAATGTYRSGLPYSMHTAGSIPREYLTNGTAIIGFATGMNGYGGENRVYGIGRNTFRYAPTWKADLRLTRDFDLGPMRRLQLMAESFNLFNHRNVTEIETVGYTMQAGTPASLPALTFLTGLKDGQVEFGQPLNVNATDFYRPRQIQFGLRFVF